MPVGKFERRPLQRAQRLLTMVSFCLATTPMGLAATLDIPAISGVIESPSGYVFQDMQLGIHWFCIEDSHSPMSPTGQKDCAGVGAKTGAQMVDIQPNGLFQTAPIKVTRVSATRQPRFFLKFGLFRNGRTQLGFEESEYRRTYSTADEGEVAERFRTDLSRLRLLRVTGGVFDVRIEAREGDSVTDFNTLMALYPKSYNYISNVILWIGGTQDSTPMTLSLEVTDSEVDVPAFDFLQVGSEALAMTALIRAHIGLVKTVGEYRHFDEEVRLLESFLDVTENLEVRLPEGLFEGVEILVDIDAVSDPRREFFDRLSSLCGATYEGYSSFPPNGSFAGKLLVAEIAECGASEIRIPFAVADDHSRTWIVTHSEHGLLLKHDHRHDDGTPDEVTMYGGWASERGSEFVQLFAADDHTKKLIPEAATNVWTLALGPNDDELRYFLARDDAPRFNATLKRRPQSEVD